MPPGAVVMVAGGAVGQEPAPVRRPVAAAVQQAVHQLLRAFCVNILSGDLFEFHQPAGGDRAGDVVDPLLSFRLAEVAVRQAVRPDMGDKVCGNLLRRVQIFFFPSVQIGQGKPIQAPGLAAAPLGAQTVALAGMLPDALARSGIKFDDVADRPVRPQEFPHGGIRVDGGDVGKARVPGLSGRPPEQGQVHHAVDDGKARLAGMVPRADVPHGVEPPHQQAGRVEGIRPGLGVAGELFVRPAGEEIHEPHVMVQPLEHAEFVCQKLFHAPGFRKEALFPGSGVQLPHQRRPETARPPAVAVVGGSDPASVFAFVGNDALLRGQGGGAAEFIRQFQKGFFIATGHSAAPPPAVHRDNGLPYPPTRRTGAPCGPDEGRRAAWGSRCAGTSGWYWARRG